MAPIVTHSTKAGDKRDKNSLNLLEWSPNW